MKLSHSKKVKINRLWKKLEQKNEIEELTQSKLNLIKHVWRKTDKLKK